MSRTRAEIQHDIDEAEAEAAAYQRDIEEANEARSKVLDELPQLHAEMSLTKYSDEILDRLRGDLSPRQAWPLPSNGALDVMNTIQRAIADNSRGTAGTKVFVKVDAALLEDMREIDSMREDFLVPIVAVIDADGDLVLHITSGGRAQS